MCPNLPGSQGRRSDAEDELPALLQLGRQQSNRHYLFSFTRAETGNGALTDSNRQNGDEALSQGTIGIASPALLVKKRGEIPR
jgi:hypothetical protein